MPFEDVYVPNGLWMAGKRMFGNRKRTKFTPPRTKRNGRLNTLNDGAFLTKRKIFEFSCEMSYSNGFIFTRTESNAYIYGKPFSIFHVGKIRWTIFSIVFFFFLQKLFIFMFPFSVTRPSVIPPKKKNFYLLYTRRAPGAIVPGPTGAGNKRHQSRCKRFVLVSKAKKKKFQYRMQRITCAGEARYFFQRLCPFVLSG